MTTDLRELADRLELLELANRYGNLIDARRWDRLGDVLADDIIFDLTGISREVLHGLPEVQAYMEHEAIHPAAHLMANVTVDALDGDAGSMTCRLLAVQGDGTVVAGEYRDSVVRTEAGWRIARRMFTYVRRDRSPRSEGTP